VKIAPNKPTVTDTWTIIKQPPRYRNNSPPGSPTIISKAQQATARSKTNEHKRHDQKCGREADRVCHEPDRRRAEEDASVAPRVVIAGTATFSGMAVWRPTLVNRTGTIFEQPTPANA
jgi:hypothetical protein